VPQPSGALLRGCLWLTITQRLQSWPCQPMISSSLAQEEVPFAHTLPPYPVQRTPNWPPTFEQRKEVCERTAADVMLLPSALLAVAWHGCKMHSAPDLPLQHMCGSSAGPASAHTGVAASTAGSAHLSGDAVIHGPRHGCKTPAHCRDQGQASGLAL
jgi:hypothetical protein